MRVVAFSLLALLLHPAVLVLAWAFVLASAPGCAGPRAPGASLVSGVGGVDAGASAESGSQVGSAAGSAVGTGVGRDHGAELSAREAARRDFAGAVKRSTGWAMGVLCAFGVGQLVLSFFFPAASVRAGVLSLAGVALTSLVRYALLAYGTLFADAAVVVCVAGLVVAAVFVAGPWVVAWVRRRTFLQGRALYEEKGPAVAREATALMAAGDRAVNTFRRTMADRLSRAAGNAFDRGYRLDAMLRPDVLRSRGAPVDREPEPPPAPPPASRVGPIAGERGGF